MTDIPLSREQLFRKKPVVIEAHQFVGNQAVSDVPEWYALAVLQRKLSLRTDGRMNVLTLEDGPNGEAKHVADIGDWIIRGVKGELYPCKPDIFAATYEPALSQPHTERAEAVGEVCRMPGTTGFGMAVFNLPDVPLGSKLFLHPPATPPSPSAAQPSGEVLTEDEIVLIASKARSQPWGIGSRFTDALEFARAIESALLAKIGGGK